MPRLNADDWLRIFEEKPYQFVTLDKAQSDRVCAIPDSFISKSGRMWGYRWAGDRNIKVDGDGGTRSDRGPTRLLHAHDGDHWAHNVAGSGLSSIARISPSVPVARVPGAVSRAGLLD